MPQSNSPSAPRPYCRVPYPITAESVAMSRRRLLTAGAAALAAPTIVPRHVLGQGQTAPSERLNLAGIGVGGVGFGQLKACDKAGFRIAVLCDVDQQYAQKAFDAWPQARRYRDFREMLQAEADKIDAVYCGTPDHNHAVICMAALRRKKHLCCVKPLTRTIHERRTVVEAARAAGVATQVTAMPNTSELACRTCELIWAGGIGAVREVHVWSNRPLWPQGMARPAGEDPVPKNLDWDLWIGPAPMRPFKDVWPEEHLALLQVGARQSRGVYHPWNFRGWWDFGTGALGDMGCHHLNTPYRALKLGSPVRIHATSTRVLPETAPLGSIVAYDFPDREGLPAVRVVWYDGGLKPPCPAEIAHRPLPDEGVLYVGDEGRMLGPKILDPERAAKFENVPKTLPRRSGTWGEWHEACRGGEPAGCNFAWAGPLTDFVLLGNIALRARKMLQWDAQSGTFTNSPEANEYLQQPYRSGWSLDG
jgi:hypothetical protein